MEEIRERLLEVTFAVSLLFSLFDDFNFFNHFYIKIEGHIYFCMMDLKYDGIYRFFQLPEVKLARKLSEFNLVRRLIMEAFFFKVNLSCCYQTVPKISRTYLVLSFVYHIQCRIDDFYSNRNGSSNQNSHNNLSRRPTISPKAPRNSVPSVSLIDKTKRKTRNII